METKAFPVIDLVATGNNIRRLRVERGLSVKDLQRFFGFEEPRAVYKWQEGSTLPSVDNLYALGILFGVPMESILVRRQLHSPVYKEQQEESCCSHFVRIFSVIDDSLCLWLIALENSRSGPAALTFPVASGTAGVGGHVNQLCRRCPSRDGSRFGRDLRGLITGIEKDLQKRR